MNESKTSAYKNAGVDLDEADRAMGNVSKLLSASRGPRVLSPPRGFAGLLDAAELLKYKHPVLAATTDGVGTKVLLAQQYGRLDGVGTDLVNHCINDLLVQGASPLFFMDYIAQGKLNAKDVGVLVEAMASACALAGCELLGGESAEMPDVYQDGALDLVGTLVGVAEKNDIIDGTRIGEGDSVVALRSSGAHTNGYSLIRELTKGLDLEQHDDALGTAPIEMLLAPHVSYLNDFRLAKNEGIDLRAMAHITGGGIVANAERIVPADLSMQLSFSLAPNPVFQWLQNLGNVSEREMYRVFNMGIGLLIVVPAAQAKALCEIVPSEAHIVGQIAGRADRAVSIDGVEGHQ